MNNKHNKIVITQQDIFKIRYAAYQWYQIKAMKGE